MRYRPISLRLLAGAFMNRHSYLFRMFQDEFDCLQRLAPRFHGKREVLAAGLRALERELRAKDSERLEADLQHSSSLITRVTDLESRVAILEGQPAAPTRAALRPRRSKPS